VTIKELKEKVAELEKENARLQDENASLWYMLDEMEKSNISDPQYKAHFEKVFANLRQTSMMMHQKVEEA